jgi:hypothetical protein
MTESISEAMRLLIDRNPELRPYELNAHACYFGINGTSFGMIFPAQSAEANRPSQQPYFRPLDSLPQKPLNLCLSRREPPTR